MLKIYKTVSASPVDYAAEELKKYLRMMMPESGDVEISYNKESTDGFRLGLLSELGLDTSDVENPELDDVIYIETDTRGGVIAGANPRAVLIAVYEYLRKNGCEWLLPSVDGERIPLKDIEPVRYRHTPSMRYRGNCIEGAVSQQIMENFIELMPKLGLNTFMVQFRNPIEFYRRYYNHVRNADRRPHEPITDSSCIQWTRRLECEMDRRGIMLHSCGHGWTNDPFGIDSGLAWEGTDDDVIPPENLECIAMVKGKRGFYRRRPANTQFCMSNPRARRLFVNYVADYAESHSNTEYLHLWLADDNNNHCECDACAERSSQDWYMILLNEVDRELTRRGCDVKIVYIVYEDTTWAPFTEKLDNPDRFLMMIAPIWRDYTKSETKADPSVKMRPYVKNQLVMAKSLEEFMLYVNEWKKIWKRDIFSFEYHFWKHHQFDLSGLQIARRLHEDARAYLAEGVRGIVQCGSQRGFFPNGFAFYTHARSMFDVDTPFEELISQYYKAAYGEGWEDFLIVLDKMASLVPYEYMSLDHANRRPNAMYAPEMKERIDTLPHVAAELRELVESRYNSDVRVETVSVRLLERYAGYIELLAEALSHKCVGDDEGALASYEKILVYLGESECETELYDDHLQKTGFIGQILKLKPKSEVSNANGD